MSPSDVAADIPSASETVPKALPARLDSPPRPSGAPVKPAVDSINYIQVPSHVQSLYEATIAKANLSHSVDEHLRQLLNEHTATFATDNSDLGFCPVLELDIDTGDAAPIKQSPRRPLSPQVMQRQKFFRKCSRLMSSSHLLLRGRPQSALSKNPMARIDFA